ncbi:flippase-like domain-containing protein [Chlorobium sp. BLA1]|uniref:lysylphosphatidylglycerol synthase domain-containing protein n=1 Tax=Candidatus Chlorobium masyuteum TaxID=2716876 RepID=UPI00141E3BBC|nr:lysylphosphatidylglycerol synthase domain-containing protein [Candidatus Chlorobium masyuteum]NHQ60470.1 flippase-like domain-containing protein [Candidatus Chlorobium masyuteum]NTU43951.1 flippase-like domain-containing protein [Chlorobiaceae bacterium]
MQNQKKSGSSWTGYAGLCLGILLIAYLFSQVDLQGAVERISLIGFSSLFILLPYLGLHVLESIAWFMLFPGSTVPISFFKLLKIQLIAETVSMTLPAGVAVGEPLRPYLCFRFMGIPVPSGVASVAVRKLMLGVAQGIYTVFCAVAGFSFLQGVSFNMLGFGGLGSIMIGTGIGVFLIFLALLLLLLNGKAAQTLLALLMRIPFKRVKTWLFSKESGFLDTDVELKSFTGPFAKRLIPIMLIYVLAWFMLAIESYIILSLLGVKISFFQVLAIDASLTMLRVLFFFVPSGLGVQDLGYIAFFQALGIHDYLAYGGAFVLLRRFKELLWYAFGYGMMFYSGVHLHDAEQVSKIKA